MVEARDCILQTPLPNFEISQDILEVPFPRENAENFFSIKSISFSSTLKFQGSIKSIELKYQQELGMLNFSIDSIFHQSTDNPLFAMVEIPIKEEYNQGKKAFEISCLLGNEIFPKAEIFVAPLKVSLSQAALSYELSSFALFGNLFSIECKDLVRIMSNLAFQRYAFDKAYSELKKKNLTSAQFSEDPESPSKNDSRIRDNFIVLALIDKITINLIKNDIVRS